MRNFVAKNDFNRAQTHKSALDYSRMSTHELYLLLEEEFHMEENWDVNEHGTEPFDQEVSKWDNPSRNHLKEMNMTDLKTRVIGTLDVETGGTPGDCGSTNILMPTFSFVLQDELLSEPLIIAGRLSCREQLFLGAKVSAGTLAFWMSEALNGTSAAGTFQKALNDDSGKATILVVNPLKRDNQVTTHNFLYNSDAFREVKQVIEGFLEETRVDPKEVRFYGNGPQFDMSIYETISAKANSYNLGRAIVPWKFWDVGSARNPKDYFNSLGGNHKDVEAEAGIWASNVIERFNLINHGITPAKHDPTFDALVETYCIKYVETLLKI